MIKCVTLLLIGLMAFNSTVDLPQNDKTVQDASSKTTINLGKTNSDYDYTIDIPALNFNDVLYVPIDELSSILGKSAVLNQNTKNIDIYDSTEPTDILAYPFTKFRLLASIEKEDIYLYGINPIGVIVYNKGYGTYFDWGYITPRAILPEIRLHDYNNDAKDELAVNLYIGSGTGISIEELHILTEDGKKDNLFIDYVEQINNNVKFNFNEDKSKLEIVIGNKIHKIDIDTNTYKTEDIGINLDQWVHFEFDDNNDIIASFGVEVHWVGHYVGEIHAKVNFDDNKFILSDFTYSD